MRLTPIAAACLLAGIALLFAGYRIDRLPPTNDELVFNVQAETIRSGKPALFFHVAGEKWVQPLAVYANAALRTVGAGRRSGRIVSAIAGAIDVALVFLIVNLITQRAWIAMIAAVILIFTPAHAALSIRGTDALLPSPLILGWLYGVLRFFRFDSIRTLTVAAVLLGLVAYAHQAGPLTAVFLWALTLAVAFRRNRARLLAATLAFAGVWVPAVAWFYLHPDIYPDTFGRWFVFAAHIRNPFDGLQAFINPNTLGTRASMYWGFWDPSWLFFTSADEPQPLLLIAAPLIAVAAFRWPMSIASREAAALVIGTALIVPLAGATFGVPHYIADAAAVLPILAVLAGIGVDQLVSLVVPRRPLDDDVAVTAIE